MEEGHEGAELVEGEGHPVGIDVARTPDPVGSCPGVRGGGAKGVGRFVASTSQPVGTVCRGGQRGVGRIRDGACIHCRYTESKAGTGVQSDVREFARLRSASESVGGGRFYR